MNAIIPPALMDGRRLFAYLYLDTPGAILSLNEAECAPAWCAAQANYVCFIA
jgi:hypothetical protein